LRSVLRSLLIAAAGLATFLAPTTAVQAAELPPPEDFRVTQTSFDSIELAWERVDGAEFYRVLVDGVWRSGVYDPESTVTVTQLNPGVTYTFEVQAREAGGEFGPGATLRASTLADNEPPTTPTGLRELRDAAGRSTGLTWNESTDNWAVVRYWISADGRVVLRTAPPTEWFWLTDPYHGGLSCGTTYEFTVQAVDKNGNLSAHSATLTATIPPC
jgi:chitodextrinase